MLCTIRRIQVPYWSSLECILEWSQRYEYPKSTGLTDAGRSRVYASLRPVTKDRWRSLRMYKIMTTLLPRLLIETTLYAVSFVLSFLVVFTTAQPLLLFDPFLAQMPATGYLASLL